jgi:hypothetical protein
MRKVKIDGKTYILKNSDEVTLGAEKKFERARFNAQMAMLSKSDVIALAKRARKDSEEEDGEEVTEQEFMDQVLSSTTKEALLDSHEAAISLEEEAIILSGDISRETLLRMPRKVVKELAAYALEELGTAEGFSEASTTVTN